MVLNLSLSRIKPLLNQLQKIHCCRFPPVVHIAGTNGKGSTAAYVSHILQQSRIKTGRFNSPHLVEARDSIQIDNKPVDCDVYLKSVAEVNEINSKCGFACTEFELLTAVALNCFINQRVDIAIFEVGVGGREDATNAFDNEDVLVTAITKVGLDHQGLLGNTLREIAGQKVGIFKRGVPAIIDGSNEVEVLERASEESKLVDCSLTIASRKRSPVDIKPKLHGDYQFDNLAVAYEIILTLSQNPNFSSKITHESIIRGIESTVWPGRLQDLNFPLVKLGIDTSGTFPILLDGAHNPQAAIQLNQYLNTIRSDNGIIFIIAFTKGKDFVPILKTLVRSSDFIINTEFSTPVEGMPWIEPIQPSELRNSVLEFGHKLTSSYPDIGSSLKAAYELSQKTKQKIVVCGSLYLVADVLRLKA